MASSPCVRFISPFRRCSTASLTCLSASRRALPRPASGLGRDDVPSLERALALVQDQLVHLVISPAAGGGEMAGAVRGPVGELPARGGEAAGLPARQGGR